MSQKSFHIKAVLFDFDGTLTRPGALDFSAIKEAAKCPQNKPILEFIHNLQDTGRKVKALSALEQFEMQGAVKSTPNAGAEEIIQYIRSKGIPAGIISRNGIKPIKRALENFKKLKESDFAVIISRETPVKHKPSSEGVLLAAQKFGVDPENILMVGDYIFDIQAGKNAGAVTVLLDNQGLPEDMKKESDHIISHMAELKEIMQLGIPISGGKLPNNLLERFLKELDSQDPSLLIRPGVGEDTAAVSLEGEDVLVLKSDPITFVTDSIGYYSVIINANDIACSGALPRWFLATLLFPSGTTPSAVLQVMHELKDVCSKNRITLCGGHTEITDAVTRPVITGMMIGTVSKYGLIDKRMIKPGHRVLLTKGVAVEGTAIIAKEFENLLISLGMPESEIKRCQNFASDISIMKEAKIASQYKGVSAMHDVTEGGIATAIRELSAAGKHKIRVETDKIPVFKQTKKICELLDINPLGLIGSGSLLICCEENTCKNLVDRIKEAGIDVECIGKVLDEGEGIEALENGRCVNWPSFETDEITRLYSYH